MEKIRPILDFLAKNRFWLSCGLMALVLIGVWVLASRSLWREQEANTRALDSKISELDGVLKTVANGLESSEVKAHPNATTKDGMTARIAEARDSLIKAWRMRREAQDPLMKFPEEVLESREFVKFFSQFSPPEAFLNVSQEAFASYLTPYGDKIKKQIPELCKIIGTKWAFQEAIDKATATGQPSAGTGAVTPNVSSDARDNKVVVQWNNENQALWLQKVTDFQGHDGNDRIYPTIYQVLALQQDLWLLEAVFKVIKEVNGDADANDLAPIRVIDHIAFGREAQAQLGELTEPNSRLADKSASATSGSKSASGEINAPSEELVKGGSLGSTAAPSTATTKEKFDPNPPADMIMMGPLHGRYVNTNFEPISIKEVHEVLKKGSRGLPDQNLELVVAKRIPVRIALKMNETKIPAFIAACSNSPFCIEINQVRINKHKPNENIELNGGASRSKGSTKGSQRDDGRSGASAAMGGGGTGGSGVDGGGGSGLDGGGSGGAAGQGSATAIYSGKAERRTNYIVDVEFYGIVRIYNPVDESRLQPVDEEGTAPPDKTAGATPATKSPTSGKP